MNICKKDTTKPYETTYETLANKTNGHTAKHMDIYKIKDNKQQQI